MQSMGTVAVAAWMAGTPDPRTWVSLCICALLSALPLGLLVYGLAVTRERELAERRNRSQWASLLWAGRSARRASAAKTEFLATMSHEIRTPMTAILGYAELLLDPRVSEADRRDGALTIRRNGEHLLAVINNVLDMTKIEAGQMSVERVPASPGLILEDVCSLLNVRAAAKGIVLRKQIEGTLPAGVRTDPTRVRQVLLNIVGNAIKFTEAGTVEVRATYLPPSKDHPSSLRFQVADSGIGMRPEEVARLFQPYSQADASTSRRFGGSGLGLCISKNLVRLLGGDVTVASEFGKGTTFTIMIPVEVVAEHVEQPGTFVVRSVEPAQAPHSLVGAQVLLAEDGSDNRRLIGFHLRRAGAEVETVENGLQAVTRVGGRDRAAPDLILMDMQMPEMDGYEATGRLRALGCSIPVIALTAHAMEGDRERCIEAGCDDYLVKPIDRAKLIETCARWLAVARANRGNHAAAQG